MSAFRNPPFFSHTTPPLMILAGLKYLGLGKYFFKNVMIPRIFADTRRINAFVGYEPAAHDVFACTYAKSGTNWLLQAIEQIAWLGEAEFDHIHSVAPWPDSLHSGVIPLSDDSRCKASPTGLRAVKTHIKSDYLPYNEKAVYISVLRDPKEVVVSSYHFAPKIFGMGGYLSIEEWLALIRNSSNQLAGSWSEHTAGFWAWRDRPNVLILFFPEITRDSRGSIRKVAEAMKVDLTEAQLDKVQERCSLGYMKAHEDRFGPPLLHFVPRKDRPIMIREGKSGNSGELLSPEQQKVIDDFVLAELAQLGSDFPYAEKFMSK